MTASKRPQRILITGAASGLGRALAELYARHGWWVCLVDIHLDRGAETLAFLQAQGARAHFLPCDVTQEAELQEVANWLLKHWGGVDVVVNNAGVAVSGGIAEIPLADWQWIVDVNLLGVARGCKVFTPLFRAQGGGHFVNVASLAGLIHVAQMAPYNATKAAVVALSETLRFELAPDRIAVSVVCPYFFRTQLLDTARIAGDEMAQRAQHMVNGARTDAETIARRVYAGVAARRFWILPDLPGRLATLFKRSVPFGVYIWVVQLLERRVGPKA